MFCCKWRWVEWVELENRSTVIYVTFDWFWLVLKDFMYFWEILCNILLWISLFYVSPSLGANIIIKKNWALFFVIECCFRFPICVHLFSQYGQCTFAAFVSLWRTERWFLIVFTPYLVHCNNYITIYHGYQFVHSLPAQVFAQYQQSKMVFFLLLSVLCSRRVLG